MSIAFDERFTAALEAHRASGTGGGKARRCLELLSPAPGERILDLGCGSGWLGRWMASSVAPGGSIVGVDASRDAVDLATRLSPEAELALLSFELGDAHALRFDDETFDAAISISVLAFCDDPPQALSELRRVLRAGGRLVVTCSDEESRVFQSRDRELAASMSSAIAHRTRHPSLARRLASLLTASGLQTVEEVVLIDSEDQFAPGARGYFLAHACRDYLLGTAGIPAVDYERWLIDLQAAAEEGAYHYGVTTYAYSCIR